jgi:hypothetical protein
MLSSYKIFRTAPKIQTALRLNKLYSLFMSNFYSISVFWTDFRKTLHYQISQKSQSLAAEVFHAGRWTDGQTDMKNLMGASRDLC